MQSSNWSSFYINFNSKQTKNVESHFILFYNNDKICKYKLPNEQQVHLAELECVKDVTKHN